MYNSYEYPNKINRYYKKRKPVLLYKSAYKDYEDTKKLIENRLNKLKFEYDLLNNLSPIIHEIKTPKHPAIFNQYLDPESYKYQYIEPTYQSRMVKPIKTEPMALPVIKKGKPPVKPHECKKIEMKDIETLMNALNNIPFKG